MQLGIKILNSSSSLNNLMYVNQIVITPGETKTVYFQTTDLDFNGQRYIASNAASMSITINNINSSYTVTKIPSNPFPGDKSIWSFNLNTTETNNLSGVNMHVTLTDGPEVLKAVADSVIIVKPKSVYQA